MFETTNQLTRGNPTAVHSSQLLTGSHAGTQLAIASAGVLLAGNSHGQLVSVLEAQLFKHGH